MIFFKILFIILTISFFVISFIKKKKKLILLGVASFLCFILSCCLTIVPVNNVGVLYSPFGGLKEQTLENGLAIKGIFDKVYKISTEVQTVNLKDISGQTKDAQYIKMDLDIKYKVDQDNAFKVFGLFRTLDNVQSQFIAPTVQKSIEKVITQYNVMEILGDKRNEIYTKIEEVIADELKEGGLTFYSVTLLDTDAGETIEQAIRAEAVAKKEVETAEQQKAKAQIEAEQKLIEAQAEADANRIINETITPELISKIEAEARLKHGWIVAQGASSVIIDER